MPRGRRAGGWRARKSSRTQIQGQSPGEGAVGFGEREIVEFGDRDPAKRVGGAWAGLGLAVGDAAQPGPKRDPKVGIGVFEAVVGRLAQGVDPHAEFFEKFPGERLERLFAGFDLAFGQVPTTVALDPKLLA